MPCVRANPTCTIKDNAAPAENPSQLWHNKEVNSSSDAVDTTGTWVFTGSSSGWPSLSTDSFHLQIDRFQKWECENTQKLLQVLSQRTGQSRTRMSQEEKTEKQGTVIKRGKWGRRLAGVCLDIKMTPLSLSVASLAAASATAKADSRVMCSSCRWWIS